MAQQFGRQVSLIVGDNQGNGLDLSQLHIKFETHINDYQAPNYANIRVYNLSKQTIASIEASEFDQLILKAGYEGNFGTIFKGTILYKYQGHENNTDSYLDFVVADGDQAYNFGITNKTLAAKSSSPGQQLAAITDSFKKYDVTTAPVQPTLPATNLPRGKVMFGPARDFMRKLATTNAMSWSIQNGQVQLIPTSSYIPGDLITLTYQTGLIGFPEQTFNGLIIRCLLNPNVGVGRGVKIDNASVQQLELDVSLDASLQQNFIDQLVNNDGQYKPLLIEHTGDTRGTPWYTKLTCININGVAPTSSNLFTMNAVTPYGP